MSYIRHYIVAIMYHVLCTECYIFDILCWMLYIRYAVSDIIYYILDVTN